MTFGQRGEPIGVAVTSERGRVQDAPGTPAIERLSRAALAAAAVAGFPALARNFALFGGIHSGKSTLRSSTLGHGFSPLSIVPAKRSELSPVHIADRG
jgi:hypothetical protein